MPFEERWNTHFSKVVEQELFNITLQLAQDPNSNNLGTTVWDASIVLAKYIEKNSRRGEFSRNKVRSKRVLELGAGMGLAGMALALLGCDVMFTDIGDVLPLLRHNVTQNVSPAALKLKDAAWAAAEVGATAVESLDWSDRGCYASFQPPYDFILAADCVYSELAVPHLLATVLHMSGPRTQTIVTNEFRSQAVHDIFMQHFGEHFAIRKVQAGKMDANYQHPLIHIYLLKRKKQAAAAAAEAEGAAEEEADDGAEGAAEAEGSEGAAAAEAERSGGGGAAAEAEDGTDGAAPHAEGGGTAEGREQHGEAAAAAAAAEEEGTEGGGPAAESTGEQASGEEQQQQQAQQESEAGARSQKQFQTRRAGSMLARKLAQVKI